MILAKDYRDHQEDDFVMDAEKLRNPSLIIGNFADTVNDYVTKLSAREPTIGFVSIDVDYYHLTKDALRGETRKIFTCNHSVFGRYKKLGAQ